MHAADNTPYTFAIAHDHPCLPGHFPGAPIVPGVVVLDHVLSAVRAQGVASEAWRLPQVKFLQPLLPGVQAQVELQPGANGAWQFRVADAADATIAQGVLSPT